MKGILPPSRKGIKHSEETKKKMSEWHLGKKPSKLTRLKISKIKTGKKLNYVVWNKGKKGLQTAWNKGLKSNLAGKKHPNWKGGITSLNLVIRHCFKYRQWRSDIFKRDKYICQLCGQKGVILESDHYPKKFSMIIKEYQITNIKKAINCKELWDIKNGRTLCQKCHRPFLKKFTAPQKAQNDHNPINHEKTPEVGGLVAKKSKPKKSIIN